MEKFHAVLDLMLKHRYALGYGLVTLLTAGGERIFSAVVFQCPCSASWNLSYGLVFLLVPALLLFILAFVLRTRTWRWLTGCCLRGARPRSPTKKQSCNVCLEITATALVAPFTWVAVALLGGTFYQCGASGIAPLVRFMCSGHREDCITLLPKMPCLQNREPDLVDLLQELRAHSQVGGWILIALIVLCLLVGTCYSRCRSPFSLMQLEFWKIYLKEEQKILTEEAKVRANILARENVNYFFEVSSSQENQIPSPEAWQQISSLYTFNKNDQHYSLLHKYRNARDGNYDTRSERTDEIMHPLKSMVDEQTLHDNRGT
ncbi:calcium homeostasis modulator protein 6-like [Sorex fumeus]|uniref:calcium homeostasis modulator protein 6-like n=1 Tax=Sorex fumeus TaxID=62283 RepID=UPI0024AE0AEF|nr:calcium homeostasis modulator protein 6-like [Sorex fumeus]